MSDNNHSDRDYSENDIAIVGMAAHLPSAPTVDAYWQNLVDGKECIRRLDDEALVAAGVPREALRHPHYVKAAAILDDLEQFDADFFGFSPKEAAIMDPQHRQFLECSWEAMEAAGHVPSSFDGAIGVFGGSGMPGYFIFNVLTNADLIKNVGLFLLRHTGNDKDFLSTRVSYCFDLKGPSVNVQTACSTSLVATHYAVQALLSGECDLALAGGVTIEMPHGRGYKYEEGEILSPDGHCRAFDHRSQGTVFGSGAGVVALRRLDDAMDDGDHIHAIIKGTAINNDGGGKVGYLAPSVDGQAAAVAEAIAVSGVDPESITYIECHGTGTPVGDPIEVAALSQAFRSTGAEDNGFCGIGSVKTNIGHLDTAAGVASLIKAARACETGKLPPSLNFEAPNPEIDFESSPFYVNHQLSEWKPKGGHLRRAGVNSLGVGGTNAHVIIEEPPPAKPDKASARTHQPILLAARSKRALDDAQANLATYLKANKGANLADVSHTLLVGRQGFDERRVLAARDVKDAIELLSDNDRQRVFTHTVTSGTPSLVFLFPGGGAQYLNMGRGLLQTEPVFKERIDQGLKILKDKHGVDLEPLLYGDGDEQARSEKLEQPGVQLPAIFLVEMALSDLWQSWGFEPAALLGHSMGENTAACVAGVLSFEDALGLVRLRGQLMDEVPAGGMLSVPLPAAEIEPLLQKGSAGDQLDLGVINAPDLCVVSGPAEPLEQLRQTLADDGIEARRIRIHIAAHSRMLDGILDRFKKYLEGVKLSAPTIPIVSNRSGDFLTEEQATSPAYWVDHLRHTVRFADCVGTLAQDESRVYLEVGPGKTLSSLTRMHPKVKPTQTVVSSLRHQDEDTDDNAFFTTVLGRLWGGGLALDAEKLWPEGGRKRLPLPTYPFQRSAYFIEPGQVLATDERGAGDELVKLDSEDDWFWRPVWRRRDAEGPELHELPPQTWLFFCDEFGVGDALAARLRELGHDVVTVKDGDAYAKIDEHRYRLSAEHGRDGYDALVRDLVADAKLPDRVAHLWLLAQEETFRPGSSFFHRNQERGFYSLFFLAQALGPELGTRALHLEVATCGMQRVDDEEVPYPEQATVIGPLGVIPREIPQISCSVVDVELPRPGAASFASRGLQGLKQMARRRGASADRLFAELAEVTGVGPSFDDVVSSLAEELCAAEPGSIVARRGMERWVREDRKVAPQPVAAPALPEGATVLITGGLGGIGLEMARHLAEAKKAKLVLTSRKGLPPRDAWDDLVRQHGPDHPVRRRIDAVRELEQLGATVMTPAADVSDVVAMKAAINAADQELGRIKAVVHAAGTLADDLIAMKSQSSCEIVFTPKVYGTMVLDELFADRMLDAFVLFASTSTRIRAAGQVDYVAANAFLNAYAQSRRGHHKRVVAINWGVWNEVGMAADAAQRMVRGDGAGPEGAPGDDAPAVHPAKHPLFKGRTERDGQTVILAELSPAEYWILDEHRTRDGQALIPGTGYLELARAAVAEIEGDQPIEIRDLFFFRPLAIEDDEVREVELRLTRDDQGYGFEIFSRRTLADGRRGWERHAQARVLILPIEVPAAIDVDAVFRRCDKEHVGPTPRGITTPQEKHLLFGPRWRVLREAAYGETEAVGRLSLADDYAAEADDYKLHPALLDLATGWAMKLIPGYDASGLWVPVSYPSFQLLRPMPATVISHVSKCDVEEGFARFDILITDEAGEPVANIRRFTIRQLPEDQATFGKVGPPVAADLEDVESGRHELSPAELAFQHNLTQGILPAEGARAFDRAIFGCDASEVVVSSLSLEALVRQADESALPESDGEPGARFQRPELGSDYVEPRDDTERALVAFWEELLGVDQIGVQDSFFDLGGHSLIAVRLFAKIKKAFHVDFPISVLFEAPTIEACAELIKDARGGDADSDEHTVEDTHKTRYTHLVAMHPGEGGPKRPFFLVAGMFGNVLNLRHLAHLIGADRPFYGLQARGLYGDHEPHETFEEMAADYLKELRSVQPHGPYMIGGFSGGGITAWEMARQLRADGEEVAMLVFLDTPLPISELMTRKEKVQMHLQNLQKKGRGYLFEWAKNRVEWELGKVERALKGEDDEPSDNLSFNNDVIEAAFYRALEVYDLQKQPVDLHLFRPPLSPTHQFGGGRAINADRRFIYEDNGWSDWVDNAIVHEVPGDHDSMVLEPNVRVLAGLLAEAISAADDKYPLPSDAPAKGAA